MKKGAPWLKTTLIQRAWAASRTKGSYLQAQYLRVRSRRGPKKAIGAVAASALTAACHMLKNGTLYHDLGANHFNNRDKGKQVLRLVNRLRSASSADQMRPHCGSHCALFFLGSLVMQRRIICAEFRDIRQIVRWRCNGYRVSFIRESRPKNVAILHRAVPAVDDFRFAVTNIVY